MTVGQLTSVIYGMTKICVIFGNDGDFCERVDGVWEGYVPENLLDMTVGGSTIDPAFEENVLIIYAK